MEPTSPATAARPKRRIINLIIGAVYLLLLPVGGLFAMMSAFATDAPGSTNSPLTILFISTLVVFPLTLIVAGVWAILMAIRPAVMQYARLNLFMLLLPIIDVVVFALINALIALVCHGSFVCHPW